MRDDRIESLLHLYEDGALNRRELLERLTRHTGSLAAATAALSSAGLLHAQAPCADDVRVREDAPDLLCENFSIYSESGPLLVYQVRPNEAAGAPRPAVLVIHENRGLNEHIKDVARRVGRSGFVGLGIDLLSRQGGTMHFPDPADAQAAYGRTVPEQRRADMISALLFLRDQPYVRPDRLGAVGFCAGGGNCFDIAVNFQGLAAAVVFYGPPPPADQLAGMNAALLGIFAQLDRGINSRLPEMLNAIVANQKTFGLHVYENTRHAFHNDTGPNYDRAAACDAWTKTIAFFQKHLLA
jgi:carboxymethylenebutenolidase